MSTNLYLRVTMISVIECTAPLAGAVETFNGGGFTVWVLNDSGEPLSKRWPSIMHAALVAVQANGGKPSQLHEIRKRSTARKAPKHVSESSKYMEELF